MSGFPEDGKKKKKTHYKLEREISDFEPVAGTWWTDSVCDDESVAEAAIAEEIEAKLGFPVDVQVFREDGHAITDEVPMGGQLLVTRK